MTKQFRIQTFLLFRFVILGERTLFHWSQVFGVVVVGSQDSESLASLDREVDSGVLGLEFSHQGHGLASHQCLFQADVQLLEGRGRFNSEVDIGAEFIFIVVDIVSKNLEDGQVQRARQVQEGSSEIFFFQASAET